MTKTFESYKQDIQNQLQQVAKTANKNPSSRLVAYLMSDMDKQIGRVGRLKFWSEIFGRDLTTCKIDAQKGLTTAEAIAVIAWSKPAKLMDEFWTLDICVKQACAAFQIERMGQIVMEL